MIYLTASDKTVIYITASDKTVIYLTASDKTVIYPQPFYQNPNGRQRSIILKMSYLLQAAEAGDLEASGQELYRCVVCCACCAFCICVPRHNFITSPCPLNPHPLPCPPADTMSWGPYFLKSSHLPPASFSPTLTQKVKQAIAAGVNPDDEKDAVSLLCLELGQCLASGC